MANKVSSLTALAAGSVAQATDLLYIVDVSAGTSGSKSITVTDLLTDRTFTGTLTWAGSTGANVIAVPDNLADALSVKEASNAYITIVTTNSSETVKVTPLLTCVAGISFTGSTGTNLLKLTDNLASALDVTEASNSYLKFVTTNSAEAVVFGKAITQAVGASTAAAGSTNGDATALPSGTAMVYPTTAADGTKGVILTSADQVTGRMVFVGNGVSTATLKIYPPSGGTINGASANAAYVTASGKGALMVCLSSGSNTWLALG